MVFMRDKAKRVSRASGDTSSFPEGDVKMLMTPDYTAIQVHSSG